VSTTRIFILTLLAMTAFAGNSLLCRLALKQMSIDPASFTSIRVLAGAITLWLSLKLSGRSKHVAGSWFSGLALFVYAAGFSFAYISLPASAGALLLFAAVQATMLLWGLRKGERLHLRQCFGLTLAAAGLVLLLFPGLARPSVGGSILMLGAGVAWGIYSLRGKASDDPINTTAGNFVRAVPMAALLSVACLPWAHWNHVGIAYAVISGAITSGVGYVIWYSVLPGLRATSAATVQLSVPVLAAAGGIIFLSESMTLRFLVSSIAVLSGIALVTIERRSLTQKPVSLIPQSRDKDL
jgi:drug/metabolite transporter (DMT)-like permease